MSDIKVWLKLCTRLLILPLILVWHFLVYAWWGFRQLNCEHTHQDYHEMYLSVHQRPLDGGGLYSRCIKCGLSWRSYYLPENLNSDGWWYKEYLEGPRWGAGDDATLVTK